VTPYSDKENVAGTCTRGGNREEPVATAFDVPGFGAVADREGSELDPGDQIEGQGGEFAQAWFSAKSKNGSLPGRVFFRVLI
jgi:hypothetical protein